MTYDFDAKLQRDTDAYLRELDEAELEMEELLELEIEVHMLMDLHEVEDAKELVELGEITQEQYDNYMRL